MTQTGPHDAAAEETWPERLLALGSECACLVDSSGAIRSLGPHWQGADRSRGLMDWFVDDDRDAVRRAVASASEGVDGSCTHARLGHSELPTEVRVGRITADSLLVTITPSDPSGLLGSSIARCTAAGLAVMDAEGRFVYANDAYCELYGHCRGDLLGRVFTMVVPAHQQAAAMANHRAALDTDRLLRREMEVQRADGSPMMIATASRRLQLPDGSAMRLATVMDITEAKQAERRQSRSDTRFRILYNNTPVMLFSTDRNGVISDVNEFWLAELGFCRDEVIGQHLLGLLTEASRTRAEVEYLPTLLDGGSIEEQEYRLRRKDGEIRDVLLSSSAVYDDQGELETILSVINDVTERRRLEAEYRDVFENASDGMYRSTPDGELLRANPALARMQGFASPEELRAAVSDLDTDWYVDAKARDRMQELLHAKGYVDGFEAEVIPLNASGRIWTSETVHVTRNARGEILYYEGTVRDITAEHKAREMARHRNAVLEMIARDNPVTGIMYEIVGIAEQQQGRLTAAIFLLRDGRLYSAAAPALANNCIESVDGATPDEVGGTIRKALHSDHEVVESGLDHHPEGENTLVDAMITSGYGAIMVTPIRDQEGAVLGVLSGFAKDAQTLDRDCTDMLREMAQITSIAIEQARLSDALMRQAQYDPLTELPNRALLFDRLERAVRDAEREHHSIGVLLLDLDDFKLVNDSLGHSAGDELLKEVAIRLEDCIRGGDTVARLGGDEFVVIVPLQHDSEYCTDIAERILESLQQTIRVANEVIAARPSIGISIYPQDGRTREALLKAADTAMYAAKSAGKNQYHFFAETMNRKVSDRLKIESELHDAIREGTLEVHYQPRVSLADGSISGAEGLLRWHHPRRGLLLPGAFIEIAERSPLIGEIDRMVLDQAVRQIASLQRSGYKLIISVNLSARELHADGFAVTMSRSLERSGIDPSGLELEITESMLMRDFERASAQLRDLKARAPGLRIAIDDFGSGYSSLNYLRHLPVDTLKIDRSFVAGLAEGDDTAAPIAKTIVELAHNLKMSVVGEGVELARQAHLLRAFGCEEAQGFLFDPALTLEDFRQRLAATTPYSGYSGLDASAGS